MNNREKNINEEESTIDLLQIFKALWKHIWIIALAGLAAAIVGLLYSSFLITPTYSSHVKLYVNNTNSASTTFTSSEISAAQSLVKTYGEILNSRTTMERIIENAELDYTSKQLSGMIAYKQANNVEVMQVTVTCTDPYEASKIANAVAEVLPIRIAEIIEGASMEVVDYAVPELQKVAPSITKFTIIGLLIGIVLSAAVFVIQALLDDKIHDDDYILKTYDYPILGVIPDLTSSGGKSYRYGKSYGYYYQSHRSHSEESNKEGAGE